LFYVVLSFFCLMLYLVFSTCANFIGGRESIFMQQRIGRRLYHHLLALRSDSLKGRAVGDFVSVYATDVPGSTVFLDQTLPVGASILFPMILAPLALIYLFGFPPVETFSLITVLVLLNMGMAYRQSQFFLMFKKLAAERIGLVNEWIQNIRALRILGWTRSFEQRIFKVRHIETKNRVHMVTNGQVMNAVSSSVTFFLNLGAVYTLIHYTQTPITSGTLLGLLWLIGFFLTRPFRQLPWLFTFLFDALTSAKRITDVFDLENSKTSFQDQQFTKIDNAAVSDLALEVRNLSLKIGDAEVLKGLDFEVKSGEFVTIVG
jgi:ATP-binding cassette subfamily B multidrug efflux pump